MVVLWNNEQYFPSDTSHIVFGGWMLVYSKGCKKAVIKLGVCREGEIMSNFSINEMLSMQKELQEKYKNKWEAITPEAGKHKLLWMIGEIGEVIDIIKKNGDKKAVNDGSLREKLVEELVDVLMYYNDVLLCYGISEDELKQAYTSKFEKNMKRW